MSETTSFFVLHSKINICIMGNFASNLKGASSLHVERVNSYHCSTVSSDKTMVNSIPGESKKLFVFSNTHKDKPSMLPSKSFFGKMRLKNKMRGDNARPSQTNHNSLSRRNNIKTNRKKVAIAITKSMIGKPTNFKHINSSTAKFNQMQVMADNDDEDSKIAAQMAILSNMIKPLSSNEDSEIPVIPLRTSSYSNDVYIKQFPIPETTIRVNSSMRKNRKKVTGMKSSSGYTPGSITKRKYTQSHIRSIKKSQ